MLASRTSVQDWSYKSGSPTPQCPQSHPTSLLPRLVASSKKKQTNLTQILTMKLSVLAIVSCVAVGMAMPTQEAPDSLLPRQCALDCSALGVSCSTKCRCGSSRNCSASTVGIVGRCFVELLLILLVPTQRVGLVWSVQVPVFLGGHVPRRIDVDVKSSSVYVST